MKADVARAVDANLNRVCEGVRVVEDICRFIAVDESLQQRLKTLRHDLRRLIDDDALLNSRDSGSDVGFAARGALEFNRRTCNDLLRANCKRIQEGLRCLEELLKLDDDGASVRVKKWRYEAYEIERRLRRRWSRRTLERGLYLVLTDPPGGYLPLAEMAVRAGLPAVQLRYKGDDDRLHLELARGMREITRNTSTLFIVNDRPDIALMAAADGVHIGQEDLSASAVRELIGPTMLLGLSTHNLDQVRAAADEPVDYIGFGPLYPTTSKAKPDPVVGAEKLAEAFRLSVHPIVAIGGLTPERVARLDGDTYNNVAVIRAVTRADDPLRAMEKLQQQASQQQAEEPDGDMI